MDTPGTGFTRRAAGMFLLALGLTCGANGLAQEKLRIATEGTYPPWSFKDAQGNLQGWDVDIANALCAHMKVQCEISAQDWDGIIPSLLAKKYDAIVASMAMTPPRRERVAFTDKYKDVIPTTIPVFPGGDWEKAINEGWYREVAPNVDPAS